MTRAELVDVLYEALGLEDAPLTNDNGHEYDTCDIIVMQDKRAWQEYAKIDEDFSDWNVPMAFDLYDQDYHARICINAMGSSMQDIAEITIAAMSRRYPSMRFKQASMAVHGKNILMKGFEEASWPEKEHLREA